MSQFRQWQGGPPSGQGQGSFRQWQQGPIYRLRFINITPAVNTVQITFEVPEQNGNARLTITNTRTGRPIYENFRIYEIRPRNNQITHTFNRLDADQDYTIDLSYVLRGQNPIVVQDRTRTLPAPAAAPAERCSQLDDKIRVVGTRMSHFLHYGKINHLLRKLMKAIVDRFFHEAGIQYGAANNEATRLTRVDVYEAIRDYLQQDPPMHVELYHILLCPPNNPIGGTAVFLNRFFSGLSIQQRRNLFSQGFPGGNAAYVEFLRTLLNNPADYDALVAHEQRVDNALRDASGNPVVDASGQMTDASGNQFAPYRPDKKEPALRFVFRASGIPGSDPDFGYIFVTNRAGGQNPLVDDRERILIHLSMTIPYTKDRAGRPTQDLFRVNNIPLTYHITDACFGVHLFYKYETGEFVGGRDGNPINADYIDRRNPVENADGSVSFTHGVAGAVGAGVGAQQITIRRNAAGNVVDGAGQVIQLGGSRKRKGKTLKKRKAKKSRKQKTRK